MVRLIPLPDRDGPLGHARLWFNPEHVTTVAPIVTRSHNESAEVFILSIELKLEGLPMQRAWLASVASLDEVETTWQDFLAVLER